MYASKPYLTNLCNQKCEKRLACPKGSHISSTRRSCVWHGSNDTRKSTPGLLSNILQNASTPNLTLGRSSSVADGVPTNYNRVSALDDYLRERSNSDEPEFGGGRRRSKRYSRRRSTKRKSSGRRRRNSRKSSGRKRRKSSGKRHGKRRSLHGGGFFRNF